jgi:murein L,D-transpeptidase YcbB/YkuD
MKKVYFSIILLLVSATTFAQENIESLLKQLCEDPVFAKQLSITEPSELQAFYKDNNFQPIWHENKAFQESFIEELRKAVQYGLNPQEYHFDYLIQPNVNQLEYELLCTHAMLSYFSDFTAGIKPKTLAFNGIEYQNQPVNTPQVLHQNIKYGSFSKLLEKYEVKSQHYKKVLETYQRLLNAPDSLFIPTKLTKTLVENKSLQQKLVFWKCIESLTIYDSEIILIEALKKFQEKFNLEADGKLGTIRLKY